MHKSPPSSEALRRKRGKMRKFVSKIGGQAVLEGVMMRGERSVATAVRTPDGRIEVESARISQEKKWWMKVPVLRGFISFFSMMIVGSKVLTRSAEVYGEEESEPTRFDYWLAGKSGKSAVDVAIVIGVLLGVLFAIGLFIALPVGVMKLLDLIPGFENIFYVWKNLIMSAVRLVVLLGYLILVSCMKDIKRVFMYHGAEHKVISCFEQGEALTVENARRMPRVHDRCGTSFLVITVFVSLIITAFLPTFDQYKGMLSFLLRFVTRLALLPVVAGVSYEVLKFLAKFDNAFVRVLKTPGLLFQRLTTREPDDSMLEVSLTAFKTVQEMDADPTIPTRDFNITKDYKLARHEVLSILKGNEEAETVADWLFAYYLGVSRSELPLLESVPSAAKEKVVAAAGRVRDGEPMQYVLGETEFYGVKMKTDARALIPRGDTEVLVEAVLGLKPNPEEKILDICTGSGAIAVVLALKRGSSVTASDISEEALALAKENAEALGANVIFVKSDLFASVEGAFDVITANPPYIPSETVDALDAVVRKEPRLALDGGEDGLDYYRKIKESVAPHLAEGGKLFVEIGWDQAEAVKEIFGGGTVLRDLEGHDRVVIVEKACLRS